MSASWPPFPAIIPSPLRPTAVHSLHNLEVGDCVQLAPQLRWACPNDDGWTDEGGRGVVIDLHDNGLFFDVRLLDQDQRVDRYVHQVRILDVIYSPSTTAHQSNDESLVLASPLGERTVNTPRKRATSRKEPVARRKLRFPPVPSLDATPSKHIHPWGSPGRYPSSSKTIGASGRTPSRKRKKLPSTKPARRPLFSNGVYASFAQLEAPLEAPPSPASSEATPSDGLIVPAVLTDVPDDWEYGDYCPIVQTLHRGQLDFFDCVKDVLNRHDLHPFWNLLRLPWSRSAKCTVRLLAQILHYQTTEGARGLKELHCAVARRSNGDLRETTWQCEEEAVGRKVFALMIQLDIFPFSFDFETSPTNELTKKTLDFVMKKWDEKVLSVLYREDVTIALCSKATAIMWAKYRLGGNGRDIGPLVDSYESNPSKYVSASPNEFLAPAHPSAILKPRFWSNMEVKCNDRDAFGTAILQLVTNYPSAECTYFRDIFEDNSSIIRLCQLVYLQGCSQGGKTTGKRRTEASALWNSDEDMSPEHWEALLACSRGGDTAGAIAGERRTEASALYQAGLDMEEEHVEALLACISGGDTAGERRTKAARLNNAGLPMEQEHHEALLACSRGGTAGNNARWGGPAALKKRREEYLHVLAKCTSASERVALFELKSAVRLNKFITDNELDIAVVCHSEQFRQLKEMYHQKYADDDMLTVALAREERKMRTLLIGSVQPKEVFDSWLSTRKGKWRESRKRRRAQKEMKTLSPEDQAMLAAADRRSSSESVNSNGGDVNPKQTAYDKKWLETFDQLRPLIKSDGTIDYSSLDEDAKKKMQNFAKYQRKCYMKRENNEASPMTAERIALLSSMNFDFNPKETAKAKAQAKKQAKEKGKPTDQSPVAESKKQGCSELPQADGSIDPQAELAKRGREKAKAQKPKRGRGKAKAQKAKDEEERMEREGIHIAAMFGLCTARVGAGYCDQKAVEGGKCAMHR